MIRLIQRRLIIPRGDTGTFTVPALSPGQSDSVGVFTIFDPITKTRVFQKQVELQDGVFNIEFDHGDTVNLQAGDYLWDIKFYVNPIIENGKVIDGTEIDSYYAAFQTPKCEIRETGDDFMVIDGQPAKIEDLNIILAATSAANAAKVAATEQAEIAATKASEAAERLEQMIAAIPTKVSELENDSGYLQEETDPTVPAWAKAAEKPSYTPQEVGALPSDTFIPSKVSDLTDDSGHYIKPASGIPASDLEETYLTEHQDLSNYVQKTDYANVDEAGIIKVMNTDVNAARESQAGGSVLVNGKLYYIGANAEVQYKVGANLAALVSTANQHLATFYGLAKAAGSNERDSELPAGQYTDAAKAAIQQMLGVPSAADIPTNVSELTNDAGYLTQHQDISGKANVADLATVATSGSYNDLEDRPTIPEVPVQDVQINGNSIVANSIANIPIGQGLTISNGALSASLAGDTQIKSGTSVRLITPGYQHAATFYGLATAAGDTTQRLSDNTVGTYTEGAKTAIQTMLDVPSNAAMNTAIGNAIGNINSFDMAVVQELPTQDISTHTIYLVPKTGETNDVYDEYVYINDAWEMVGNTQIDLSNYVQFTDYATADKAGVVKINNTGTSGLAMQNGELKLFLAQGNEIKSGTNNFKPIVSSKQHESTFYGLAKAAGDTTQSQSDNAIGTYTTEAKAAIRSMIGAAASADISVQDVQINGNSILENNIANIPIAAAARLGAVKGETANGLEIDGAGAIKIYKAQTAEIQAGINQRRPIVPYNQHESMFYGLAKAAGDTTQSQSNNSVGSYTNTAKGAIQKMLGITDLIAPEENDLVANQAYAIGDMFTSGGKLYKTTSAIISGGTIIPTTNCVETTVIDALATKLDAAEAGLKVVRLI